MKLQMKKLTAAMLVVGSGLTLVGCGGSDTPSLVATADAVTTISPTAVAETRALVSALSTGTSATFALGDEITFANATTGSADATTPANAVLTITEKTDATGAELGNFSIASSDADAVEGTMEAGSCRFRVRVVRGVFSTRFLVGQTYVISLCRMTLPTRNVPVTTGTNTVDLTPSLTLNTRTLPASKKITVTINNSTTTNTSTIKVGNTTVNTQPVPTGLQ